MKNNILSPLERRNELTDKIYDYLVNNALGHEKTSKISYNYARGAINGRNMERHTKL